jgi:hypothetical protein
MSGVSLIMKDNVFKAFTTKMSSSPCKSPFRPAARDPILQEGEKTPERKVYVIKPINSTPERPKGKAMGRLAEQGKKSSIFAAPANDFTPSRRQVKPNVTQSSPKQCFKKAECQPEQRDPILQDSVTCSKPKLRSQPKSKVFEHLFMDREGWVENKERYGK